MVSLPNLWYIESYICGTFTYFTYKKTLDMTQFCRKICQHHGSHLGLDGFQEEKLEGTSQIEMLYTRVNHLLVGGLNPSEKY